MLEAEGRKSYFQLYRWDVFFLNIEYSAIQEKQKMKVFGMYSQNISLSLWSNFNFSKDCNEEFQIIF